MYPRLFDKKLYGSNNLFKTKSMSHIHSVLWNQVDAEGEFSFSLNFLTISIVEERVIAGIEGANYVAMYKPAGEKSIWYFNASQMERWSLN